MLDKLRLLYRGNNDWKTNVVEEALDRLEDEACSLREAADQLREAQASIADEIADWATLGIAVIGIPGRDGKWVVSFKPGNIEHPPYQEIAFYMGGLWNFSRQTLTFERTYYHGMDILHNVAADVRAQMELYHKRIENYRLWEENERAKEEKT